MPKGGSERGVNERLCVENDWVSKPGSRRPEAERVDESKGNEGLYTDWAYERLAAPCRLEMKASATASAIPPVSTNALVPGTSEPYAKFNFSLARKNPFISFLCRSTQIV